MVRLVIKSCLIWLWLVAPAFAQPTGEDQAKKHFKLGRVFQDSGEYLRAADEYKEAYLLDHKPEMLFNIAQAYRLGGEKQLAIEYYQQYLGAQPDGAGAPEAQKYIDELGKQVEAERAAKRQSEPPPTTPPPTTVLVLAPADNRTTVARSQPLQIAGIATAGAGV